MPRRKGFDAELDLEIIEGFSLGTTVDVMAADLGLDSKGVRDRFKDLSAIIRDARGNIDFRDQGHLIAVMRHQLREARQPAA